MPVILERKERSLKPETEIIVPEGLILRNVCHQTYPERQNTKFKVIDADQRPLPLWPLDSFYLASIGSETDPLFLELRFEEASENLWIALLMTNERLPYEKEMLARRLIEEIHNRGIFFEAVIGVEALGSKLSQEMARLLGPRTLETTFQKGKPRLENGRLVIGPPKHWVDKEDFVLVKSGTSQETPQAIFMDRKVAEAFGKKPTVIVDDARLTSGTIDASILLAQKMGINVAGVATVLNEAKPTIEIMGIPYIGLAKIPVFRKTPSGFQPIGGSFDDVQYFYKER